jgi:hypothetical protein
MRVVIDSRTAEGAIQHVLNRHNMCAGAIFCMEIAGAVPLVVLGMHGMDIIITLELDAEVLERHAPRLIRVPSRLLELPDHAGMHLTASYIARLAPKSLPDFRRALSPNHPQNKSPQGLALPAVVIRRCVSALASMMRREL